MFQLGEIVAAREQRPRGAELQNLTDGGMGFKWVLKNKSAHKVTGNTWTAKCTKSKTFLLGLGLS